MDSAQVQNILNKALALEEIHVKGDNNHYDVIAVDACFQGMSRLKKEQMVLVPLTNYITKNEIHAVTVKAYTPEEWARDKKLMSL